MQDQAIRNARDNLATKQRRLFRQQLLMNKRKEAPVPAKPIRDPSYLSIFSEPIRQAIRSSRIDPTPDPLPPLRVETICFYSRANQPVFSFVDEQGLPNPHFVNESLSLLSRLPQSAYPNYQEIVAIFQRSLCEILKSVYPEIIDSAVLVAGNKSLGNPREVFQIAELGHEWVLTNHVFDKKLRPQHAVAGVMSGSVSAMLALSLLLLDPEETQNVIDLLELEQNAHAMENVLRECQTTKDVQLQATCLRILREVIYFSSNIATAFIRNNGLDLLYNLTRSNKSLIKELACMCVRSLVVSDSSQCNAVLFHSKLIDKLISLLGLGSLDVKTEILQIFAQVIEHGECVQVVKLLFDNELIRTMSYVQDEPHHELQTRLKRCVSELIDLANKHMDEQELEMFEQTMCKYGMEGLLDECIHNMPLE